MLAHSATTDRHQRRRPRSARIFAALAVLAAAVGLHVAAPPPAHAAVTYIVTSTADLGDSDVGDGTCETTAGGCTLRAAVEQGVASGDDVVISLEAPGPFALGSTLEMDGHFTVVGMDRVIDVGGGAFPAFEVRLGSALVLDGLVIQNAAAPALDISHGELELVDVELRENDDRAIEALRSTVTITRSSFIDNAAGGDGGAIRMSDSELTVDDSTFADNHSESDGGAIYGSWSEIAISASTFESNGAGDDGGAVYGESDSVLTVTDSAFTANRAVGGGGAVAIYDSDDISTITGSSLTGNRTGRGGGALLSDTDATLFVRDSDLIGNGADGGCCGGAIANYGTLGVTSSTLRENFVDGGPSGQADSGGAIENGGFMIVLESTIADNWTRDGRGGGIYQYGADGDSWIERTTISGNRASTIDGDTDDGGGGAYIDGGVARFLNSTISGNDAEAAGQQGGGIYADDALVALYHATVARNDADEGGGVHATGTASVTSAGTIVAENTDANCSGVVASVGGNVDDDGTCTFHHVEDQSDVADVRLTELADHGGPTWTHGLLEGSPALDASQAVSCSQPALQGVDQRGEPRGVPCDSGAFEGVVSDAGPSDPPSPDPDPDSEPDPHAEPDPSPCADDVDAGFTDVDAASVHARAISCLVGLGIAAGGPGNLPADHYGPALPVTRGQVASLLARLVRGAGAELPPGANAFGDDDASVHHDAINALVAAGVIDGHADGTFRAGAAVTRAQVASLLARTHRLLSGAVLADGTDAFDDDDGSTHERAIDALAVAGVIEGTETPRIYDPTGEVRRDQMASFLVRLADVLAAEGSFPVG